MKVNLVSLLVALSLVLTIGIVVAQEPNAGAGKRGGCGMHQRAGQGGCQMQDGAQCADCPKQGTEACPKVNGTCPKANGKCPKGDGACAKATGECPKGDGACAKATGECPKGDGACAKATGECPKGDGDGACAKATGECPKSDGKAAGSCPMKSASGPAQVAAWPAATLTGAVANLAQAAGGPVTFTLNGQKVQVGSPQAVQALGLTLANGQQVTVAGWKAAHDGRSTVIAGSMTVGEKTYAIRDANGRPAWAGQAQGKGSGACQGRGACR